MTGDEQGAGMVSGYQEGGRRALDHVLAPEFLQGLRELPLAELRERRHMAEQEEADLSYARRLIQGRLDMLRVAPPTGRHVATDAVDTPDEQRRPVRSDAELVASLTGVLAEGRRSDHGSGRYTAVQPSRVGEHRRRAESAVSDPRLSDLGGMDAAQLADAREQLVELEEELSADRHRVQAVMDACTEEVTRRYRDGIASVDDVLRAAES